MKELAGKIAIVTGGGTGMGRELARQLVAEGCHVAICDVSEPAMAETKHLCESGASLADLRVTTHVADVSDEDQVRRFRDEVAAQHNSDSINLLFNNAGIGGGNSFINDRRENWERTFNICWGGVYLCTRAFLPMLIKAAEGHLINTSSVNGFWAMLSPNAPHTAYCAAKFAVKGFTEALITDLRLHAPHVKCSVVMPGLIGTAIMSNTRKVMLRQDTDALTPGELAKARARMTAAGIDHSALSDQDLEKKAIERAQRFIDEAPTSAAEAATIILEGVKADRWRILVGRDAETIDERVRATPEDAYQLSFFQSFSDDSGWQLGMRKSVPRPGS